MAVERDERQEKEKLKAVDLAFSQIEKQFGKGSIMRLGQKGAIQPIDSIPTGAISIDYALGVGGVLRKHAAWAEGLAPFEVPRLPRSGGSYDPVADMGQGTASAPSRLSARLLWRFGVEEAADVARARRTRFEIWRRALADWVAPPWNHSPRQAAPLVFPLSIPAGKDRVLAVLRERGVVGLDLWRHPHPAIDVAAYPRSAWLREHVVGLPVHQGISERRIRHAADVIADWCARQPSA